MDRSAIEIMKFGYDFKAPKDKIRTMQGVLGKGRLFSHMTSI